LEKSIQEGGLLAMANDMEIQTEINKLPWVVTVIVGTKGENISRDP
jgi:hypothetical protein